MLLLWLTLGAQAAPIDFDAAVRAALEGAPGADIVDAERDLAVGEAQARIVFQNPAFELEQIGPGTELRLTIPVPVSGAPVARMQAASADRRAADARYDRDRAELAYDVGLAYLGAMAAEERAALAARSREDAQRVREAVVRLHAAGELSDVDRAVAEAEAAIAVSAAAMAEQDAVIARMRLEVWLGQAPVGELDPVAWPALTAPGALDPAALPATRAEIEEAQAARRLRTATVLDRVPTPTATIGQEWGPSAGSIYGVGFEIPLLSPGAGQVRSATASARIADSEAETALLDATAALAASRLRVEAAERGWQAMSDVPGLDRALDDIATALALGEYSAVQFATRRASLIAALEGRIEARYRLESARLDLWRLAGQIPTEVP